ncbi:MAG: VTT domain-containing protein [Thermoflexales bacterium]|nr:VTT domain-containing protein [Thermoflexales bacterium]
MLALLRATLKALTAGQPQGEAQNESPVPTRAQRLRTGVWFLLALAISTGVLVLTTYHRETLASFGRFGLLGLFVISVLGNATVLIPAPVFVMACAAGPLYGFVSSGLVAGAGAALGEMTSYMAGYGGTAILPQGARYQRLHQLMERYGPLAIFILSAVPNPLFDVGGVIAGMLRMPAHWYLAAAFLGKALRLTLIAFVCTRSIPFFSHLFAQP